MSSEYEQAGAPGTYERVEPKYCESCGAQFFRPIAVTGSAAKYCRRCQAKVSIQAVNYDARRNRGARVGENQG